MYVAYLKHNKSIYEVTTTKNFLIKICVVSSWREDYLCDFTRRCIMELQEYFEGKRASFDLPFKLVGTEFQKKVWNALLDIPYGKTVTYLDIAKKIDNPKSVRAVGGALHKNPIMIVIPCHRVIGKNNSLVGYAYGTDLKRELLSLENNFNRLE